MASFSSFSSSSLQGGVFESALQDSKAVKALEKLPTRLELMQKIAVSLKQAGAQGIAVRLKKAAGGKLVKAVNMAYNAEEKRDGEGAVIKAE
jgi:ribosomal protein L10